MEKIVVIGTGKEAESFLYKNRGKYEVILFIDKTPRRNSFRGISVITLDSIRTMYNDIKHKIIIATNAEEYIEIARELSKYGLEEFKDFFYFEALDKKLAFFWGNCYIAEIVEYIKQFPSFNEKFWIYPCSFVHIYDRFYLPRSFFSNVSLFLYQDITEKTNGMLYSSEGMYDKIPAEAIKIKIPNLYRKGFAFFPQSFCKGDMRDCEQKFVINIDNHDSFITQKKRERVPSKEIALQIENGNVFEREKIIQNFEKMLNTIERLDFDCDVKIAAFIRKHYKDKMIFIDPGHVSKCVFDEYVSQILKILGLYEMEKGNINICSGGGATLNMPVYGCVRDALGLKWVEEANCQIKKGSWMLEGESLNILEYVKQYSYICSIENQSID